MFNGIMRRKKIPIKKTKALFQKIIVVQNYRNFLCLHIHTYIYIY